MLVQEKALQYSKWWFFMKQPRGSTVLLTSSKQDDDDDKNDDDENEMAYAWLAGPLQGAPVKMIGRRTAGDKPLHCILSKQMLYDKMNNTSLYYWMLSINF